MNFMNYPTLLQEENTEPTHLNLPPTPERYAQLNIQASVHNILENIGEEPQREPQHGGETYVRTDLHSANKSYCAALMRFRIS